MAGRGNVMSKIVIVGAGAIGRGFLPWILEPNLYDLIFVDINEKIVELMNKQGHYKAYRVKSGKLEERVVPVKKAFHPSRFLFNEHRDIRAIFMNVGPRNCLAATSCIKGSTCQVILCENDPQTVNIVKDALNHHKVYFAIPDVITSNTSSPKLLAQDPLSVITEDGTLFVDGKARGIKGNISYCDKDELDNCICTILRIALPPTWALWRGSATCMRPWSIRRSKPSCMGPWQRC